MMFAGDFWRQFNLNLFIELRLSKQEDNNNTMYMYIHVQNMYLHVQNMYMYVHGDCIRHVVHE